ncbi:MAG: sodium/proline symporter [Pseudomonadota bacterium]|nr:sodium/proline symporter [Pseudomonadota bacterium]
MLLASFLFCFVGITCWVGFSAVRHSRKSEKDYFLASQSISPYVLAFSGSASKFSGFVFAGYVGLAYASGAAVLWLGLGLAAGGIVGNFFVIRRLQETNHGGWALSLGELITFQDGENRVWLRRFIGIITVFFLSIYAAAQLQAGGKALEVALGQPLYVGIMLSMVVIIFYCWAGGIRASIWTDTAQIAIMTASLVLILIVAVVKQGGITAMYEAFIATAGADHNAVSLLPQNMLIGGYGGLSLYFLGAFGFGVCVIGQPHVLVRAMALSSSRDTRKFFITTSIFDILFLLLAALVGLCTRVIMQNHGNFDPELALFLSANEMLPPLAVGFVLAGAFSSTLSTADSQVISCSASLMRDLPEPPQESLKLAKAATVGIALLATLISLWADKNIFALVAFAFTGLGASIGCLLLLRIFNISIPAWGGFLIAFAGGGTVVIWTLSGLKSYINESIPALLAAALMFVVVKVISRIRSCKKSANKSLVK